jgi:hypothetical protein
LRVNFTGVESLSITFNGNVSFATAKGVTTED